MQALRSKTRQSFTSYYIKKQEYRTSKGICVMIPLTQSKPFTLQQVCTTICNKLNEIHQPNSSLPKPQEWIFAKWAEVLQYTDAETSVRINSHCKFLKSRKINRFKKIKNSNWLFKKFRQKKLKFNCSGIVCKINKINT